MNEALFLIKPQKCPKCGEYAVFFGHITDEWLGERCIKCGWQKKHTKIREVFEDFRKVLGLRDLREKRR